MLLPVPFGDWAVLRAASRVALGFCLGDILQNEVSMSTRVCLRHLAPSPLPLLRLRGQPLGKALALGEHGLKFFWKDSVTIMDQRVLESLVGRARYLGIAQALRPFRQVFPSEPLGDRSGKPSLQEVCNV